MKKIFFLFLVSSFVFPVSIFATDGAIPTRRQEIKNNRMEIKTTRTEIKNEIKDLRHTRAENVLKRLRQGIVNRYENILKQKTMIEARIAKIEAMVVPTPKVKRDLTAAKAKLATFDDSKYKSDLALFDAKSAEVLASTTPLKLTPELKTSAKTVDGDLKNLRQTLADTLRLIIKSR